MQVVSRAPCRLHGRRNAPARSLASRGLVESPAVFSAAQAVASKGIGAVPRTRPHGSSRSRAHAAAAGGDVDPQAQIREVQELDELIDRLLTSTSQQQMAQTVAENIMLINNKFWLRVASRGDAAGSKEKEQLGVMANAVMTLVNAVMKKTERQLEDSSKILQEILSAAADEKGDWYLPLTPEQVARVRAALEERSDRLDEALLSNAFAWIRKCTEDRFDSMVQLIQKVLQLYAARQLRTKDGSGIEAAVNDVVYAEEKDWAPLVRKYAEEGRITEPAFMEALQRRMEGTVLGLQSGSYAQRVQAEYLKEVESRAKEVFKALANA